jgi:hypothetical protein
MKTPNKAATRETVRVTARVEAQVVTVEKVVQANKAAAVNRVANAVALAAVELVAVIPAAVRVNHLLAKECSRAL